MVDVPEIFESVGAGVTGAGLAVLGGVLPDCSPAGRRNGPQSGPIACWPGVAEVAILAESRSRLRYSVWDWHARAEGLIPTRPHFFGPQVGTEDRNHAASREAVARELELGSSNVQRGLAAADFVLAALTIGSRACVSSEWPGRRRDRA